MPLRTGRTRRGGATNAGTVRVSCSWEGQRIQTHLLRAFEGAVKFAGARPYELLKRTMMAAHEMQDGAVRGLPRLLLRTEGGVLLAASALLYAGLGVSWIAFVALLLGYGLRTYATGQTRTVTAGGVTASIPQTWVYQPGAQDLLFTAVDPRNPGQRYSVTQNSGSDPSQVASATVAAKSQVLSEFQVLDRGTTSINGTEAPTVTYTYVTTRMGAVPQVIQGRDIFLKGSNGTLIVTLESPAKSFPNAIPTFEQFAGSVQG